MKQMVIGKTFIKGMSVKTSISINCSIYENCLKSQFSLNACGELEQFD